MRQDIICEQIKRKGNIQMAISDSEVIALEQCARELRKDVIYMINKAGAGHPGGSLSATDIVAGLYFKEMRVDPQNPKWPDRDRFVLSKGHCCPILYAALCRKGFFGREELDTLRRYHSKLQGHPDMRKTPGLDMSSGSLGNGLSIGLGMALSARTHGQDYRVFVLMGDGEQQEGAVWEAAMIAAHHKVTNLVAIVDRNHLQLTGPTEEVIALGNLAEKYRAFGWEVAEINGNNMREVLEVLEKAGKTDKPFAIIADTIKGKGVSFMEGQVKWHSTAPNDEQAAQAIAEIMEGCVQK